MTSQSHLRVLVVDDDDVSRECVHRALARLDTPTEVVSAADGLEALQLLRGEHPDQRFVAPDVVLLDLNMPQMSGHEFLTELRADPALKDSRVIVLTTSSRPVDRTRVEAAGVLGYVEKSSVSSLSRSLGALLPPRE